MRLCRRRRPAGSSTGAGPANKSKRSWPEPLDDTDPARQQAIFEAKVDLAKQRAAATSARTQSEVQAELDLNAEYYKAIFEVGKGTLERSRAGAETVQKAAAAIVTLYTGLLAVTFSVAERPLPPRGAVPAILLGSAIVLSTFYVAFLGRSGKRFVEAPTATSSLRENELERAVAFLTWMRESALRRAYFLRASVLALGFGVMLLPAPFVALGHLDVPIVGWTFGKETTGSAAAAAPDWPPVPATTGSDPELTRIVYRAQVKEAADRRQAPAPARSGTDDFWFALTGVALGLCLLLAALGGRGEEKEEPDRDGKRGHVPRFLPVLLARRSR
jgi:hypothetical protein